MTKPMRAGKSVTKSEQLQFIHNTVTLALAAAFRTSPRAKAMPDRQFVVFGIRNTKGCRFFTRNQTKSMPALLSFPDYLRRPDATRR